VHIPIHIFLLPIETFKNPQVLVHDSGWRPATVEDSRERRSTTGVELQQRRTVEAGSGDAYTPALGIKSRLFLPNSGCFSTIGRNIKNSTQNYEA
jgi:hypothetical protein